MGQFQLKVFLEDWDEILQLQELQKKQIFYHNAISLSQPFSIDLFHQKKRNTDFFFYIIQNIAWL